ncbi:hypothetical protein Tco_0028493, partial [Tanacetum coccineum]
QSEVSSVESTANEFLQIAPSSLRKVLHVDIFGYVFERRKKPG